MDKINKWIIGLPTLKWRTAKKKKKGVENKLSCISAKTHINSVLPEWWILPLLAPKRLKACLVICFNFSISSHT